MTTHKEAGEILKVEWRARAAKFIDANPELEPTAFINDWHRYGLSNTQIHEIAAGLRRRARDKINPPEDIILSEKTKAILQQGCEAARWLLETSDPWRNHGSTAHQAAEGMFTYLIECGYPATEIAKLGSEMMRKLPGRYWKPKRDY